MVNAVKLKVATTISLAYFVLAYSDIMTQPTQPICTYVFNPLSYG
jgi:hypothetical protein